MFPYLSVCFFSLAIIADWVAKKKYADAAVSIARFGESGRNLANAFLVFGTRFRMLSFVFAGLAMFFWIFAVIRRENSCWQVLLVLFAVFILLQFVLI